MTVRRFQQVIWSAPASMHRSKRRKTVLSTLAFLFLAEADAQSTSYEPVARWGHAATLINTPPTLLVHGGKTASGYSFTSAPNTADLLSLDLSSSFSVSSPPWEIETASNAPAISFHTLSPVDGSNLLLFGGDETGVALPSGNDSSVMLSLAQTATYTAAAGSQPMRRIYHSATVANGRNWIFGGQKNDGSGVAFNEMWSFDGSAWQLAGTTGETPPALWHHSATALGNQVIVIGGVSVAAGTNTLASLSTVWVFAPASNGASGTWTSIDATGTAPIARRGHVAVALDSSRILVHGGANLDGSRPLDDASILTVSGNGASWSSLDYSSGTAPSARFAHTAVLVNRQVVMAFGYGATGATDAGLYVFDPTRASWLSTFAVASAVTTTTSATSSTLSSPTSTVAPSTSSSSIQQASDVAVSASASSSPAPVPDADSSSPASSPTSKIIIGGSVGGGIALVALGVGAALYARRRRRNYYAGRRRRPRADSDTFTTSEKAMATRQPWRRFDMLEDEEAIWTGRNASQRVDDFYDTEMRSPSRDDFADAPLVGAFASEPSLFDGERTPTRKTSRTSQKATPRAYRHAEMEEVEPVMSQAYSPRSSLFGSAFSPVPATPDVYNPLKRSSTWWNRFAVNAGIVKQTPSHDEPIRDPSLIPHARDEPFSSMSSRAQSLRIVEEQAEEEEDETDTLREEEEADGLLRPQMVKDESTSSISSSVLEERVKAFEVTQQGPRLSDSASEADDPFADAQEPATPRVGTATPGSIVWRGDQVFSPIPPLPPLPADYAIASPPSVYAPTPLNMSVASIAAANSGVRKLAALYEKQREVESAPSSPSPSKKGPSFVKKRTLFVTNE